MLEMREKEIKLGGNYMKQFNYEFTQVEEVEAALGNCMPIPVKLLINLFFSICIQ